MSSGVRNSLAYALGVVSLIAATVACGPSAAPAPPTSSAAPAAAPTGAISDLASLYPKAKQEGSIVWYGQFSESQASTIIEAFEKTYPGIDIKFSDVKPTEAMTQVQVQVQANNVQIDVSGITDTNVPGLVDLQVHDDSFDWTKLGVSPESMDLAPGLIHDFSLGDFIVYNTTKVSAGDAPRSWDDLLDPKWKGKIAVDGRASFLDAYFVAPSLGRDKGLDYARKLAAQSPSYQTNLEQVLAGVVSGQFDLGTAVISQVLFAQSGGKPVGIAPVSPINMSRHWLYMPKGAPHPAAGQLFIGWMASDDGQAALNGSFNAALPETTRCPGTGSTVEKALCDNKIDWYSPKSADQLKEIATYENDLRKIFGTYTGA